jgi:thiol-disulfide isomerase/thioredoxin
MLDGSRVTLESLHGHVVVLNFWASWCSPCRRELPRLDAINREMSAQGATIVAVSIDENVDNARGFAKSAGLAMPVAHDGPRGLARELDLRTVPATVVLDRDGHIVWSSGRSDDDALAELAGVVRRMVGTAPVADGASPGGSR